MSIRLRYGLVFCLLIFGFAVLAYRQVRDDLESRYREAVEENLVDQAQFVAALLSLEPHLLKSVEAGMEALALRRFEARIYEHTKRHSNLLLYVTDASGILLYHSQAPALVGADYSRWRDVHLTLNGHYGARSSRQNSEDELSSVLHVAAPILSRDSIIGVVTVGKPVTDFHNFLQAARYRTFWWLAGGSVILVLLGLLAGLWVTHPVRRIEADLAAKQYVESYVQTLTHELKSPISAILGATEILESNPDERTHTHFLGNIRSETQRLRDLVTVILQVAALERLDHLEQVESIPWMAIQDRLVEAMQVPCHQRQVTICWPPDAGTIICDRMLMTQALLNLLLNAAEYSPESGTIELKLLTEGSKVRGRVRDHGPGIPDFALPRLFDKFYSLPKPASNRKGTGLGLAFARQVLRLHGGEITLQNASDGGALAEFWWVKTPRAGT